MSYFLIISAKDETKGPLVIPLNQPSNEIIDRIKESRAKRNEATKNEVDERPDSELTLDELAARELLRGTKTQLFSITNAFHLIKFQRHKVQR